MGQVLCGLALTSTRQSSLRQLTDDNEQAAESEDEFFGDEDDDGQKEADEVMRMLGTDTEGIRVTAGVTAEELAERYVRSRSPARDSPHRSASPAPPPLRRPTS